MHDYSQRLGDAVKRARESQGLTQTELAEKIEASLLCVGRKAIR